MSTANTSHPRAAAHAAPDREPLAEPDWQGAFRHNPDVAFAYHRIVQSRDGPVIDYVFLDVNEAFERLTGLKRAEIVGRPVSQVLPGTERDPADWIGRFGRVALTGEGCSFEHFSAALDRWFLVLAYSPAPKHFAALFQDITARRVRETTLREAEATTDALLDAIGDSALLLDPEGRIVDANEVVAERLGVARDELIGKISTDFLPEDVGRVRMSQFRRLLETRRPLTFDDERLGRHIRTRMIPVCNPRGHVTRVAIVGSDLTDRVTAHEQAEQLAAIVRSSDDAIFSQSVDGIILTWNPGAERLYGYTPEEIVGRHVEALAPESHPGQISKILARIRRGERVEHFETVRRRKDGGELQVSITVSPIHNPAGQVVGASTIARDIGSRAEKETRHRNLAEQARSDPESQAKGTFPEYASLVEKYEKVEVQLQAALEKAQRSQAEVSALLAATRGILKNQDFEASARAIFDACKALTGARAGYVALLSDDGEENEVLFLDSGGAPCTVDPSLPMPIRGLRSEAYHDRAVAYENEFWGSDWVRFMPEGHVELDNVLFSPLVVMGRAQGLIGIANKPGGFTEDDARVTAAFGELAAIALSNSRNTEALEQSEERFRRAILEAPLPMMIHAEDGEVILINQVWTEISGYTPQEIPTIAEWTRRAYGKARNIVAEQIDALYELGSRLDEGEFAITTRSGGRRTWKFSSTPLGATPDGRRTVLSVAMDVTAERRAQARERELARLPYENPSAVMRIHDDGTVAYANPASAPLLAVWGCSRSGRVEPPWLETIQKVLEGGTPAQMEAPFGDRVLTLSFTPSPEAGYVNVYTMDVTEQASLRNRLARSERLAVAGHLATTVAHEINSPLQGISMLLHTLKSDVGDSPSLAERIELLEGAFGSIRNTVRRLLDLNRPCLGELREVDVNAVILDTLELLKAQLNKQTIHLTLDLTEELPHPLISPRGLSQLILNLVNNASEAIQGGRLISADEPAGREIRVETTRGPRGTVIRVSDDGPGISEEDLARVFDPFYTRKKNIGMGIGLSICSSIVEAMGGTIAVANAPQGGALFTISIPVPNTP